MALNDSLANALSGILNDGRVGRKESTIKPASKVIKQVLEVMKDNHYVGSFQEVEDSTGNKLKINLLGNINKCGVIKPRYSVKRDDFERFEERYLLARDMGILIVSTPSGIMTHKEAKEKNTGGKLLAYCY